MRISAWSSDVCSSDLGAIVSALEAIGYHAHEREALATTDGEDRERAARRAEIRDLTRRVVFGAVLTLPIAVAVMAMEIFDAMWVPDVLMDKWVQQTDRAKGRDRGCQSQ